MICTIWICKINFVELRSTVLELNQHRYCPITFSTADFETIMIDRTNIVHKDNVDKFC